jgi:hypothetical protein
MWWGVKCGEGVKKKKDREGRRERGERQREIPRM